MRNSFPKNDHICIILSLIRAFAYISDVLLRMGKNPLLVFLKLHDCIWNLGMILLNYGRYSDFNIAEFILSFFPWFLEI